MLAAWMWLFFIYGSLGLLFGIADFTQASITGTSTVFEHVTQYQILTSTDVNFIFGSISVPTVDTQLFTDIRQMLFWQYNIFNGDLNIVRLLFLYPLSGAFTLILLFTIAPIILQVIATLRSLVPRIGPFS